MPEPGMGANNDHSTSASSAGNGLGGGSDSGSEDRSNDTTADSIASSPTTADTIASSPTAGDTLSDSDPATAATADGPAGGSPEAWDGMMAEQAANARAPTTSSAANDANHTSATTPATSLAIDPASRTANTADGPMGGSPSAFEALAAAGAANANTLTSAAIPAAEVTLPTMPAIQKPAAPTGLLQGLGRLGRLTGLGAFLSMMAPTPIGGARQDFSVPNPNNVDVNINFHPAERYGSVTVNGQPTGISVTPTYDANGNIDGFQPATTQDQSSLSDLTGLSIAASESTEETEETNSTGETPPELEEVNPEIHDGAQGKHQPGHNNHIPGRSTINDDVDPQGLIDEALNGDHPVVGESARGDPVVDFGRPIGVVEPSGEPTSLGTIHSGQNGSHVVPANPATVRN